MPKNLNITSPKLSITTLSKSTVKADTTLNDPKPFLMPITMKTADKITAMIPTKTPTDAKYLLIKYDTFENFLFKINRFPNSPEVGKNKLNVIKANAIYH